ncbi:MAG: nucleotide exchange factor GrpE [Paludibacteraceae bacterium]
MTKSKKKQNQETASVTVDETTVEQPVAPETAPAAEQSESAETPHDDFEAKYNDLNDQHLRLMAEFDNYRKRMMRERADLIKNASERVVVELLPIVDDFERSLKAMETADNVAAVTDGVNLIYQKILTLLKQQGVTVIETENQPFNEECHEAVTTIPAPTEELKGKIVDCVQKGYQMNDKVIRFPKVVVGQ